MVISTTRWAKYLLSLALGVVVFFFVACNSTTTNNTHTGNGAETKKIIADNPIDTKCEETANSACKNSEEKSQRCLGTSEECCGKAECKKKNTVIASENTAQ